MAASCSAAVLWLDNVSGGPGSGPGKEFMKIGKIKKSEQPGCVVGIGSSAGGLEALQQFLTFLPADFASIHSSIRRCALEEVSMSS